MTADSCRLILPVALTLLCANHAAAQETVISTADLYRIIQQQQEQINALRERLDGNEEELDGETLSAIVQAQQTQIEELQKSGGGSSWPDRLTLGGYGSFSYGANNLDNENNTFDFRRFVLTGDARPNNRLQAYFELEFERFAELELEKKIESEEHGLEFEQALEGKNGSEIALEQAWMRYRFNDNLNLDMGALLVPMGRFNLQHDDNRWNLPIRPLADRGASVLPSKAAWTELGMGFSGTLPMDKGLLDYQLYLMNGAQLDFEQEIKLEAETEDGNTKLESVIEASFSSGAGPFSEDLNESKAMAGRLAWRSAPEQEIAFSAYYEDSYTPRFLPRASLWSVGLDGLHRFGGLVLEYEFLHTEYNGLEKVADGFARSIVNKEGEIVQVEGAAQTEHKVEIGLASNTLASKKDGYWIELRYPFRPSVLEGSALGQAFPDGLLVPTLRLEQVFNHDLLRSMEFENGQLSEFDTVDATISRLSAGLAWRLTPAWVFSLSGEYAWTGEDSLSGLTNYLNAGDGENDAFTFRFGGAYSF